jgi:hypothetical protein
MRMPGRLSKASPASRSPGRVPARRRNGLPAGPAWLPARIRAALAALFIALAVCGSASAEPSAEAAFAWNRAGTALAAATTPGDFLSAARLYQNLFDLGVRNGGVFCTQGLAFLQAKRYEEALRCFLRSERSTGRRADLSLNMRIALAGLSKTRDAPVPWQRIVLFWHYGLSCAERTWIALGAFTVFWLALALRALGLPRLARAALVPAAVAFILFGSSAATTVHEESSAPRARFGEAPAAPLPR